MAKPLIRRKATHPCRHAFIHPEGIHPWQSHSSINQYSNGCPPELLDLKEMLLFCDIMIKLLPAITKIKNGLKLKCQQF
ncbi:MAG: hypothetical protein R6U40_02135 [Desulfobacterales bacterium]